MKKVILTLVLALGITTLAYAHHGGGYCDGYDRGYDDYNDRDGRGYDRDYDGRGRDGYGNRRGDYRYDDR